MEQQIRTEKSVSKSRLDVMTNLQEEIKREKDNRMQLHKDYDAVKRSLFQEKRKQSINEKQILGLTNSLNESKQLKEDAEKYLRMMIPMMRKLLDRIVSDQIKIEEVEQANIELSNAGKIQNKKISNLKEEVGKFTAKLNELSSRF